MDEEFDRDDLPPLEGWLLLAAAVVRISNDAEKPAWQQWAIERKRAAVAEEHTDTRNKGRRMGYMITDLKDEDKSRRRQKRPGAQPQPPQRRRRKPAP